MAKKKQRSLLRMQQEKLRQQKAAKAQKQAAQRASQKKLPGKGKTTANKPKATVQRGLRRDAMAKKQLQTFGRALKKTIKQSSAQSKLDKAAKGSKGSGVRTGKAAPGKLATTKSSTPTSQRVEKVKVKVEPQKQLKGGKTPKALPPGQKGGAVASTKGARRKNINKNPATKGQVGKPGKGGVKPTLRLPPKGGTASTLMKNAKAGASLGSRGLGGVGLVLSGISTAQDLTASLKRGEGYASLPKLAKEIAKGNNSKKTSGGKTNRRGRSTSKPKPAASKSRSGRTPDKATAKTSPARDLRTGSSPDKATRPTSTPTSKPTRTPAAPKTSAKKSTASTYKKHGSDLHIGRHKTLKEHRAAVAERKKKKNKPDSSQARALSK